MKLKQLGANRTELTMQDGAIVLFSYETPVAAFVPGQGYIVSAVHYSVTTSKHIGQWIPKEASRTKVLQSVIDALAGAR